MLHMFTILLAIMAVLSIAPFHADILLIVATAAALMLTMQRRFTRAS